MDYRIISADDHIDLPWLPRDLWQTRVPPQWRERAPKVVDTADGPYWTCDGERWETWGGLRVPAGPHGGRRNGSDPAGDREPCLLDPSNPIHCLAGTERCGSDFA